MSSEINTNNINTEYPVPGISNDTEGFRTNFSEIKQGLDTAKTEINDIIANGARTDSESDFNGSLIKDADVSQSTFTYNDIGSKSSDSEIDFANGHYQLIDVTADLSLTLVNWPAADRYASIRIAIVNSDTQTRTITWLTELSGQIKKNQGITIQLYDSTDGSDATVGAFPDPFTVAPSTDPHIVDFWTVDGGVTVFANYVGKFV